VDGNAFARSSVHTEKGTQILYIPLTHTHTHTHTHTPSSGRVCRGSSDFRCAQRCCRSRQEGLQECLWLRCSDSLARRTGRRPAVRVSACTRPLCHSASLSHTHTHTHTQYLEASLLVLELALQIGGPASAACCGHGLNQTLDRRPACACGV
jgi:hypothetical protein